MRNMKNKFLLALTVLPVVFFACSKQPSGNDKTATTGTGSATSVVSVNSEGTAAVNPVIATDTDANNIEKPLDPKDILPPTQSIKHLDEMVSEYQLGQSLTPEQVKQNTELKQKIIRGTFDIKELCRLSLGKHWDEITQAQRDEFVGLMTKLLETKAIFSKEQLHGENKLYDINYQKETYDDTEKKKATVVTKMNIPKDKTSFAITYKMLITPFGWKIYDVIVDDASLLSNYKFQFDRIITTSGYNDLISRMKKKLDDISK